jgi:plasmid stabilization system protein ParE
MEVVWTDTALETFLKVIDYLFDYWTLKEVEDFELNVDQLIDRIASFNQICPESNLFSHPLKTNF